MLKDIKAKELLGTEEFIREPVDNLCREIDKSTSKKIILGGGRGCGKSTILYHQENRGLGSFEQLIYTCFDSGLLFYEDSSDIFHEQFFNHYYELVFSRKILNYIKRNYYLTYEKHFKDFELLLNELQKKTDYYINNAGYKKVDFEKYYTPLELSSLILEKFKKIFDIRSFNLAIDRFDWTNGSNELLQKILSQYFDMFDKVIITTDDDSLEDVNNRKLFLENQFSFIDVNYGYDEDVVKQIIRKRIQQYNRNIKTRQGDRTFPEDMITDIIYQSLIDRCQGNISLMLNSVRETIEMWQWDERLDDLDESFDIAMNRQLEKAKTLKKMSPMPKLYL